MLSKASLNDDIAPSRPLLAGLRPLVAPSRLLRRALRSRSPIRRLCFVSLIKSASATSNSWTHPPISPTIPSSSKTRFGEPSPPSDIQLRFRLTCSRRLAELLGWHLLILSTRLYFLAKPCLLRLQDEIGQMKYSDPCTSRSCRWRPPLSPKHGRLHAVLSQT